MNKDFFYKELIRKYRDGSATDKELEVFFQLVQSGKIDVYLAEFMDEHLNQIQSKRSFHLRYLHIAAILICCVCTGLFFYYHNTRNSKVSYLTEAITAAEDQAILTLANGRKIRLDSNSAKGDLAQGFRVLHGKENIIDYRTEEDLGNEMLTYHEIAIPKGGKYQMILSDGTKVWLNAGTKLKFPIQFGKAPREVELYGEAYFEVRPRAQPHESHQPFIVHTRHQAIQVLGTSFNIKAYQEDFEEISTLVTGRVKVINNQTQQTLTLNPGKEAIWSGAKSASSVRDADVEEALAWKNGDFIFNETPIREIMKQLARWYDVEVEFNGIGNDQYSGYIPRDVNLKQVLDMMERTGELKFEINNKKIYVKTKMPM
ncbi:DUF4974 domain-containing protein [Olivibacter sp. CPCC 100613]|uniref:FecR family protein n=1 Tax=Olivibacter sp. CPCC 100613 TaxID=3079931 RepID=UPI002FF6F458